MLEVGVDFVAIALGAEVAASGQDATRLVGVLDDLIFTVDGFRLRLRFGKVNRLPVSAFDHQLRRASVAALVVRAGNLTGRGREGQGPTLRTEHGRGPSSRHLEHS